MFASADIPNVQMVCQSGCIFQGGMCRVDPSGFSCRSQPVFSSSFGNCPAPCKRENNKCVRNDTYIKEIISPYNCYVFDNETCTVGGRRCPLDCIYDKNKCYPKNNKIVCAAEYQWTCPYNCKYNHNNHRCVPLNDNAICELINHTLTCPTGCSYIQELKKCISENINVVCGPEYKLICPTGCGLNPYGTKCIGSSSTICNITDIPLCAIGCGYDKAMNKCVPRNDDNVCEKVTKLLCPKYYFFDIDAPICNRFNQDILCKLSDIAIQYPSRLSYVYDKLKCVPFYPIDCTNPAIISCPSLCAIDYARNKCTPSTKNAICGDTYLSCPLNTYPDYNGCTFTGSPTCSPNQILFNITENNNPKRFQLMCGEKWVYDTKQNYS